VVAGIMMINTFRVSVFASALTVAAVAGAQQAPAASASAKPAPAAAAAQPPAPPAYTYDPQGRRDPFLTLLSRGEEQRAGAGKSGGLPGLTIGDVTVKGIVRDRSGFIAMIQGPDTKTFIIRTGEKLMDGTVKAITADTVVFSQDVKDPLSTVKQKEVRKTVRASDGGRG
jgi:Tfp pilus assembly protein PilP